MNLIDHFERVAIVNLPDRSDRRREMDAELARIGQRVDGQRIHYFPAIRPDDAGGFPSIGARGCFLSNLAIIEQLVLEDDLAFAPALTSAPATMGARLQQGDWDFAYLGHIEPNDTRAPDGWFDYAEPLATTHFYALNGPVLEPLRDFLRACLARTPGHPDGSPMHVDGAYSLFRTRTPGIRTLLAAPSLGGQRSSRSDIYPNRWFDRVPLSRHLVGLARQWKNRVRQQAATQPGA